MPSPGAVPFGLAAGASPHPWACPPREAAGPPPAFLHAGFSSLLLPALHPHRTSSEVAQGGRQVWRQQANTPVKQVLINRSAIHPSAGLAEAWPGRHAALRIKWRDSAKLPAPAGCWREDGPAARAGTGASTAGDSHHVPATSNPPNGDSVIQKQREVLILDFFFFFIFCL